MYYRNTILFALLIGLLFIPVFSVLGTSVSRMSICDIEGIPGETIDTEITLEATDPEERSGFWYTYYKETEGDNNRMDITPWIEIEPNDYVLKEGEIKVFNVRINIPEDAEPGLWGATAENAGREGHSAERRSYVVFKDAITGGNVYSGFLITTSVKVLSSPNPFAPIINFVKQNTMTVVLLIVIVVLMAVVLLKGRKQSSKSKSK